jgi:hypothetical protein
MADPGIGTSVRYWLHYKNLASSLYKQFVAARKVQDDYEQQVIATLQRSGMENARIQINGGTIQVGGKREPAALSLTAIERLLHSYFKQRGGKDETGDIMTFIRANRGYTVSKHLKQSNLVGGSGGGSSSGGNGTQLAPM